MLEDRDLLDKIKTIVTDAVNGGSRSFYNGGNSHISFNDDGGDIEGRIRRVQRLIQSYSAFNGRTQREFASLLNDMEEAQENLNRINENFSKSLEEKKEKIQDGIKTEIKGIQNEIKQLEGQLDDVNERIATGEILIGSEADNSKELRDAIAEQKKLEEQKNTELTKANELTEEELTTKKDILKRDLAILDVVRTKNRLRREGLDNIRQGFEKVFRVAKQFYDVWGKIDQSAANFAKSVGISAVGMNRLRASDINAVVRGGFGIKYNVGADELLDLQKNYASLTGRNIRVSAEDLENMAAMNPIMGENGGRLAASLENFGMNYSDAAEMAGRMFKEASEYGIDFENYSKSVVDNIKLAQNYTFRNGINGLESMAKKAAALKIDMQQISNFAEKVSTVEGAINTSAQLQVLGGPFAQFADPFGMLGESLTDMEGLQDRFQRMIEGLAVFDAQEGRIRVSSFNQQRIRAAAAAMGMDYSQMMDSVQAAGRRRFIGNQLRNSGLSEEDIDFLSSIANVSGGKATVSYIDSNKERQTVSIEEAATDRAVFKEIKASNQSESEDIKSIATMLRGWDDIMTGITKQRNAVQAQLAEWSGAQGIKGMIANVSQIRGILETYIIGKTIWDLGSGISQMGGGIKEFTAGGGFGKIKKTGNPLRKASYSLLKKGRTLTDGGKTIRGSLMTKGGKVLRAASKVPTGGAVGGGIMAGALTGINEFMGDNNHTLSRKIGETVSTTVGTMIGTYIGGAIGSAIPFAGTAVGAMIGGMIGGGIGNLVGGNDHRRNKKKAEWDLGYLQGDYNVSQLRKIREGDISASLARKMRKQGDYEIFKQVNSLKTQANNMSANVGSANFYINGKRSSVMGANGGLLSGPSHANGGMPIMGSNVEVEGGEYVVNKKATARNLPLLSTINNLGTTNTIKPRMMEKGGEYAVNKRATARNLPLLSATNNLGPTNTIKPRMMEMGGVIPSYTKRGGEYGVSNDSSIKVDPVNINMNGTIRLEGANGQSVDLMKYITDPVFITKIAKMIESKIEFNKTGSNIINKGLY